MNNREEMLSPNTRLLVAIAGAVAMNCKPCLETLVPAAMQYGIEREEIAEVVSTVAEVRENVFRFTNNLVTQLLGPQAEEKSESACCGPDCGCKPSENSVEPEPASGKV